MISNTTTDLEDHLKEIDNRLQALSPPGARVSDEIAIERERVREERESTQQCLTICARFYEHINQVRPNFFEDVSAAQNDHQVIVAKLGRLSSAKRATANTLQECQEKLANITSSLEEHLKAIDNRLQVISPPGALMLGDDAAERERIQEEKDSITQCLAICEQASEQVSQDRTNVFEDVSAAQEAHQLIVATLGDLISAKRVTAGLRAAQWLGQMSDASLQQLSRDRQVGRVAMVKAREPQSEMDAKFEGQYGAGRKLS